MHKVSIKPEWSIRDDSGQVLAHRVLDLLADVQAHGSLSGACKVTGSSYRHAWNLIRQGESQLGMPLLNMERGKGSSLTPVAEKLVWAGHRITARLTPMLETLASELETELAKIMTAEKDILKVHASHGFAIEKLIELLVKQGHNVERRYVGSQESAASLYEGHCALAGFHIPLGEFEDLAFQHYAKWLDPQKSQIIHVATRRQGLMVAQGNPLEIYGINDLTKPGVRFINRQPSSGTYFLLECFLKKAGIDPAKLHGFNQSEFTHAAVAAFVASGMADVGLGVETPSRRFHLDFVPLATERYFLVCNKADLVTPHLQAVLQILHSSEFKQSVNALAGYSAEHCGQVQTLQEAFPDSFDLRAPPAK
ncbi:substrate-binding domain-containing protein [uncultured Limnohabitans sp.]|jgi:molybdate transport repressor ModE-like protein|uniref:helix-turn-helix transcriptional regulator n=1 Tax=uncultured Limnohabitans sp. TaxID=768543 RepID=UPI00261B1144|nr:substrate-binding domain-containing protein [uncultured Limnohabitans sp.]